MIGRYRGYFFKRARVCDVLCVDLRARAYHVWAPDTVPEDDDGYVGHYSTQKEMRESIDAIENRTI
jgi:hypothetical protein